MKTKIYTELNSKLLEDWRELWEKSEYASYTNGPQWFVSVLEAFSYKDYRIIAVYESSKLIAISGLFEVKKYGISVYTIPPNDFVCGEPFLVDLNNKKVVKALCLGLTRFGKIFLDNVPGNMVEVINDNCSGFLNVRCVENYRMPIVKDEQGTVLIRHRSRLLQRARKIEPKVQMKFFSGSNPKILKIVFNIDEESTKEAKGYNAFSESRIRRFYKILARNFKDNLLVSILYNGDDPIMYNIGFITNSTFYSSQIAQKIGYEQYSLGRLFLVMLMEHLGKIDLKVFDFGPGDDHVKRSFSKEPQSLNLIIKCGFIVNNYVRLVIWSRKNLYGLISKNKMFYSLYRRVVKLNIRK